MPWSSAVDEGDEPAVPGGTATGEEVRPLTLDDLERDLRARVFRARDEEARAVGAEVELIPFEIGVGHPVPIEAEGSGPATLPLLRALAAARGWTETVSYAGSPAFLVPAGGLLSFEPGGQVEYASSARGTGTALLDELRAVVSPIVTAGPAHGIELRGVGLDPATPAALAPLRLRSERYLRMAGHFDRRGSAGRRMMRQTAAIHLNLDLGRVPLQRWRVANRLAPLLAAIFANSPRLEGAPSGYRSTRALQWRRLDPTRSGLFGDDPDPIAAYRDFALDAEAFLLGPKGEPARPLRVRLLSGEVTMADWRAHLTTLFPEVRPRGYLEIRSIDALPPDLYVAPLVFVCGVLYDGTALGEAERALPPADGETLDQALRDGVTDPGLRAVALRAWKIALEGAGRLAAEGFFTDEEVETARLFVDRYTRRGLDPGSDQGSPGGR